MKQLLTKSIGHLFIPFHLIDYNQNELEERPIIFIYTKYMLCLSSNKSLGLI